MYARYARRSASWGLCLPAALLLLTSLALSPTLSAQPAPGCDGTDGCISVEVLEVSTADGETTFTWKITTTCQIGISFVAFELPSGVTPSSPAEGSGTYTNGGITWDVVYTGTSGQPGYPSIKFEGPSDGDIKDGDMVEFSYTLPGEDFNNFVRVQVKSGQLVNTVTLDPSDCGDPCLDINLDIEPLSDLTVPGEGGFLSFRITYTNKTDEERSFEARLVENFPDGTVMDPARGPWDFTLGPNESLSVDYTFPVRSGMPEGEYFCEVVITGDCRVGFNWTKLPRGQGRVESKFLLTGFPNPFNPSATIRFDLEESSTARLAVYDVMGRQVALLDEGFLEAGTHQAVFDARGLPSGLYFAQLEANGTVETLRLSLLK